MSENYAKLMALIQKLMDEVKQEETAMKKEATKSTQTLDPTNTYWYKEAEKLMREKKEKNKERGNMVECWKCGKETTGKLGFRGSDGTRWEVPACEPCGREWYEKAKDYKTV